TSGEKSTDHRDSTPTLSFSGTMIDCMSEPGWRRIRCGPRSQRTKTQSTKTMLLSYKELEVNALGTTWDLMLSKAYIDGGIRQDWDGNLKVAVYTDGEVNNPARNATFWSVEMSISLQRLINSTAATLPKENDVWSMIFARSEWKLRVQNRTFIKDATSDADWWSWEVTGAVNLHIPSRWGLIQFKVTKADKTFTDDRWHVYRVLYDMFDALKLHRRCFEVAC
ncbi:hypothetical protein CHS0354_001129, partial [Potamilus streckersoni]